MPKGEPRSKIEVVALFSEGDTLENLAVRSDGSIIATVNNKGELWYVPPYKGETVTPVKLQSFGENSLGIVEVEPDIFLTCVCHFYDDPHDSHLYRLDLNGWKPGTDIAAERVFTFTPEVRGLNGICKIGPNTLLVAASFSGQIWRIDIKDGNYQAQMWLAHDSMGYFPGAMKPEQPGINGIKFDQRRSHVYYSCTAKKLLMRVHVNPWNLKPDSEPELIVGGRMGDDLCIDETGEYVYLTTHRQNTLDRVSMNPAVDSNFTYSVAGDPFDEEVLGPSSVTWGRNEGDLGRVAYMTTDGGTASPPPDGLRSAKLLRVTLFGY